MHQSTLQYNTLVVMSRLPFVQTRLYAAQAARKVESAGAAEHAKFQPQEVQVSGRFVSPLQRRFHAVCQDGPVPRSGPWLAWSSPPPGCPRHEEGGFMLMPPLMFLVADMSEMLMLKDTSVCVPSR